MKKLLCLLLSILMLLSFVACESADDDDDDRRSSRKSGKNQSSAASSDYKDAIDLLMKVSECDISEKELKSMFPDFIWEYYEEEEGESFDEICEMISESLAEQRTDLEDEFGEDVAIQYEVTDKTEVDEEEFEEYKNTMAEQYGVDPEIFGECYTVEFEATMSGQYEEESQNMTYHVVEIDGTWYIAEILLEGF